ncbi:MAG: sigma-54-dependent Fis family transcriptional regulator [Ignavibacteria bacterium]|nr:sigma-54-dependent Fis family transcriptional regulator [Ignavibacteria bacterium]
MEKILIIDDDPSICESIKMILEYENYIVESASNAMEGIEKIKSNDYKAILLDIKMPEMDGLEAITKIKEINDAVSIIMISAHASLGNAIEATKKGAYDFIEKPIDRDKLLITIRNAVNQTNLVLRNKQLKEKVESKYEIIGQSQAIKNILETIRKVAPTNSRVLITGENGTGKELVAQAIYRYSNRSNKPFVEVNCAAIPNELIESELFGHEKGAFTGATSQRIGKFEQANGGTLFLDEIGDMSLNAQAKVLRSIEEGAIERVGGKNKIPVDVRIIAATNKNLMKEIAEGRFREDLFHRLSVIVINVPPLRERREDIPLLIEHFTRKVCEENKFPVKKFNDDAIEYLKNLEWKGNVRELKNFVERIIIMNPKQVYDLNDVKAQLFPYSKSDAEIDFSIDSFQDFKDQMEKIFIIKKLNQYNWNITKTAEAIGIQRSHLYNKIKKYGIEKEEK